MKNRLHYQISEYDCGPTSMLNAISYLFQREEIPPEIIRNIMLYCLDCYSTEGVAGKSGTSRAAMMFLSNWLNGFGRIGQLPVTVGIWTAEAYILEEKVTSMMHCEEVVWWFSVFFMTNGIMCC